MSDDPDVVPANILQGFVPNNYAESKRNVLLSGLRSLRRIYANRNWEDWLGILAAFTLLTEEVAAEVGEEDFRNVDTSKGSAFQRKFTFRWESYEGLLQRQTNYKPLSKQERHALRVHVKQPEIRSWYDQLPPTRQRQMNHPNRIITAWKAATKDRTIDPLEGRKPDLQQRIILDQDNQLEQHRKKIAELQTKLEDHDWNYAEEITGLLRTLKTKLRDRSTGEQLDVLKTLAKELGFTDVIKTLARAT